MKKFFKELWANFIVNQFEKIDLHYKESCIIESFRKIQIDSLQLETKLIKYQKKRKGGAMTGKYYRILTLFKVEFDAVVHSKLVNAKSNKTISHHLYTSLLNN